MPYVQAAFGAQLFRENCAQLGEPANVMRGVAMAPRKGRHDELPRPGIKWQQPHWTEPRELAATTLRHQLRANDVTWPTATSGVEAQLSVIMLTSRITKGIAP